jgi:hypothetical protein
MPDDVLVHVVLVSFKEHVSAERREDMRAKHQSLGERCGGKEAGVLCWRVDWNLDQRKNYHLMEFTIFADAAAFERFKTHPAHVELGAEMRDLADWVVGDLTATLCL